jgi:hypothetical protein
MIRRLFTLVSALSLLICVLTVLLWATTRREAMGVTWYASSGRDGLFRGYGVSSAAGHVEFTLVFQNNSFVPDKSLDHFWLGRWAWDGPSIEPAWKFAGFWYDHFDSGRMPDPQMTCHGWDSVVIPSWFALTCAAILPSIWIKRHLHARRAAYLGRCSRCGYDLRATPDRCPECGTPIPTTAGVNG